MAEINVQLTDYLVDYLSQAEMEYRKKQVVIFLIECLGQLCSSLISNLNHRAIWTTEQDLVILMESTKQWCNGLR
ncbi:hypothetical protein BCR33DRAFT_441551 [Rhizoclosmatium globosum]|uniref:Uncharacterized protein n=1 Tax=Rhizoclosmatium globosum TaxID=329046 RepID=A0A1Y2BTA9_9FUNG|nr:hypothetical protein BCR33DRAFT_441551 [Rhizoclosmatium globosum]|eukprot:ORY37944.1 hypothetical protein BCR33DRAFT_441551 [Rhizoclosmatium globosum]